MPPTAAVDGARVLASVTPRRWHQLPLPQRDELADWLRANGVNPDDVLVDPGVAVVALDAPAIVRDEVIRDTATRRVLLDDRDGNVRRRRVHSVCRVPLPAHLADPP